MTTDNIENVKIIMTQDTPKESPVLEDPQIEELEQNEEKLRDMLEGVQSPESIEVKEPKFASDVEAKLTSLAKKASISTEDMHTEFAKLLESVIQLEDVSLIEKQRSALQVLEMQVSNYEAEQPKPDFVMISIPYENRKIELTIKWSEANRKFINQFTIDGDNPYESRHKEPMYTMNNNRDGTLRTWLKTYLDIRKKQDIDKLHFGICQTAAKKRDEIDELAKPAELANDGVIIIPGYESCRIAGYDRKQKLWVDTKTMAAAIIDKLHVISYKKDIWTYCDGVYINSDDRIHEEVVKICNYIDLRRGVKDIATEVVYRSHNQPRMAFKPFNRHVGIPCANGVVDIDLATGVITLGDYNPDQYFTFKIPVCYKPDVDDALIMDLMRGWVHEKDIDTLIQIAAQALLQKIYHTTFKKLYLLNGANDTGKSSFVNLLIMMLSASESDNKYGATQNHSRAPLSKLVTNNFATYRLDGKLINAHCETGMTNITSTDALKGIVGETECDVEPKGVDAFSAEINPVLVFGCNGAPHIAKDVLNDTAFWPKLEYVVFPFQHEVVADWERQHFTPDVCSAFLNHVLRMILEICRNNFKLVVNTPGAETLERILIDASYVMKFIVDQMERVDQPVIYEKHSFMLACVLYCRDKRSDDFKELTSLEPEDIQANIEKMRYHSKAEFDHSMKLIDGAIRVFAKELYHTKTLSNYRTAIGGVERFYFAGNWKFKSSSKYKIDTAQLY
jgi:Predicted ATPase